MQTKTYFANNVPAALEVARQELGEDALLVDSKPTPPHARQYGRVEVTFAWNPPDEAPAARRHMSQTMSHVSHPMSILASSAAADGRGSDLDEIRAQIRALRDAVGRNGGGGVPEIVPEGDGPVFSHLCAGGLSAETAREIARLADSPGLAIQALAKRIAVEPFVEMKTGESRTLAFIGQAGRGKTTSLVKVALGVGLARRIPVRIYSVGSHPVGGYEQMARYAAILGVPFQSYESIESLNLALNGDSWKGLALIDTPGTSTAERGEMKEFGQFFSGRPEIEKHLVLRADARSADMLHTISRFAGWQPSRLLFTGLDEAVNAGAMAETLIRGGIPVTFVTSGSQIPEDLEDADAGKIARDVLAGNRFENRLEIRTQAAVAA